MSSRRDKRKVRRMCHLCDARFDSHKDQAEHFNAPLHKFMMAIKRTQMSYMGNAKTLSEQITETGKKESLIGLEYIYEYAEDSNGVRMYECKLCDSGFQSDEIFFHIVGIQHRVLYLVKHHPIMGIEADFEVQNQAHYRKLANNALAIEQTHGRKKINVVNEVYVEKHKTYEDSDSETSSEGSSCSSSESRTKASRRSASPVNRDARNRRDRKPKDTSKMRRERRARARLKLHEEEEFQQRDDSLSRERDRFLESRRDSLDMPRLPVLECGEDFDVRTMHRGSNPMTLHGSRDDARVLDGARDVQSRYHDLRSGYLSDNRDIPKFQQDTLGGMAWQYGSGEGTAMLSDTRVGSSAQHGVAGIPPYQPERPFQPAAAVVPPLVPTLQLIGKGPTPQDASEDVDLRRGIGGRGGPSVFSDVNRSSAAGDSRDQNRRRNRSPDPRDRSERYRSRFAGDCGDIDVRFMVPTGGISFRELKAAHEGRLSGGFSSTHLPLSEKKQEKDNDSDMEVCSMEFSDCEPEDFWCNEELFDFLKSYHIGDEDDVQFILKAIKVLSEALIRHKTRKEELQKWILEEKQKLELEKKVFSEIKKRKEDNIFATTMKKCVEPENIKLFKQVTGEKDIVPGTAPAAQQAVQKPQETVKQPEQVTGSQRPSLLGAAPGAQPAVQKPQAQKVDQPQPPPSFQKAQVPGIAPAVPGPQAQKVDEPPPLTNFQKALVSGSIAPLLQAAGRMPLAQKVDEPPPLTSFQKALLSGSIAPLLQAAGRMPLGKLTQPQQVALTQKALLSGLGPLLQQLQRPQGAGAGSNQNPLMPGPRLENPNLSKQQRPLPGQAAGGYSVAGAGSNQNPLMPGPRLDNPNLSKQQRPLPGQAAGGYSGAGAGSNQNPLMPGPRLENPNLSKQQRPLPGQAAGGYSGPEMRFSQNPQIPAARFNNPDPSKQQRPSVGGQAAVRYPAPGNPNQPQQQAVQRPPGSEAHFNPSQGIPDSKIANPNPPRDPRILAGQAAGRYAEPQQFPGSRIDNSGSLDKTKPPLGAGPETRFNQNPQISGPRFDNPSPSTEQRPPIGQAAGGYSGPDSRYNQNQQFPGPRTDNSGSLNKTPLGAGSEMRFTQNQQIPGSRSDNLNPSKAPRPPIGQAAGGYSGSDSRFNQNPQFTGSRMDNSGSLDKTKPPVGADLDAQYKQTQWNSGPQSGIQGFYNEARPATGMAAGRYGEQYTQNQWQPQFSSRGGFGSGVRPLGPQSQQPAGSAGISSDRHQGTWPNQDPPKTGVYPAGILKNRTGNPP